MRRAGASVFLLIVLAASAPVAAQLPGIPGGELLRQAALQESRGDLEGAEGSLRALLDGDPTSAGAIFALARVLGKKGELAELRPLVDRFLAAKADAEVHGLKLQLLVAMDSTPGMVAEAERWMTSARRDPDAYRTVAAVYDSTFGPDRALEVLKAGRAALGPPALALELGDALVKTGSLEAGVDEWAHSVAEDGSGIDVVERRLRDLGDAGPDAARRLVRTLGASGLPEQGRTASRVALQMRLGPEALELAQRHVIGLSGRTRSSYLAEVGRLAHQSNLAQVATWAYGELAKDADTPQERRQFEQSVVEVALEAGDTATALEAQRRIASSLASGSDDARRARADIIRLEAVAAPESVRQSFAAFRAEFPSAPEIDGVAAAIAASFAARGDADAAGAAIEGVDGPRTSLERAYLRLGAGDVDGARELMVRASSGLPPVEGTSVVQLVGLFSRVSEQGSKALVDAALAAHRGRAKEAAAQLAQATERLAASERPPLLAEAARMADQGGDVDRGAEIRRKLLDTYPDAPEVGEASLALARHVAGPGGNEMEAIRMLEDLITSRPNAAVVPEARLELQRLRNRGL
jgi:hypothetical protein